MVIHKMLTVSVMIAACFWTGPLSGIAQDFSLPAMVPDNGLNRLAIPMAETEATALERRASIVDQEGDQFIAKTEDGEEFRLPVEGAPSNVTVGDELRLVPDPDAQTIYVYKVEPTERQNGQTPGSQL